MNAPSRFEELLQRDGVLIYKTRGVSMRPMLKQDRDLVIIRPVEGRLKKYDIPLYRRKNGIKGGKVKDTRSFKQLLTCNSGIRSFYSLAGNNCLLRKKRLCFANSFFNRCGFIAVTPKQLVLPAS